MKVISEIKSFGGIQGVYTIVSGETKSEMRFAVYIPPLFNHIVKFPVLFWLSGLTCSEENFITKSGFQRIASELGVAVIAPDTSPRGLNLPGDSDSYDFGLGAGFYLDAKMSPWDVNYRMYSHITKELPYIVEKNFPVDINRAGIFGHSMGGHGALTIALKNQHLFKSVSAFSPIASLINCPWGQKALRNYIGPDESQWRLHDAVALIQDLGWSGPEILIDQGGKDQFLSEQLKPYMFRNACGEKKIPLRFRLQNEYDHSYYFIATFIEDHIRFHADNLKVG